jgi:hypothetical protein
MWASEKGAIHLAARTWFQWKGIWMQKNRETLAFNPMEGDTAWIIGPEGVEWHDQFKSCYNYIRPRYDVFGTYEDKQKRWNKDKAEKTKKEPKATITVHLEDDKTQDNKPLTWVNEGKQFILCPNVDCNNIMEITADVKNTPFAELQCCKCKTPLEPAVAA